MTWCFVFSIKFKHFLFKQQISGDKLSWFGPLGDHSTVENFVAIYKGIKRGNMASLENIYYLSRKYVGIGARKHAR
jgi:hypothetical protein